MVGAACWPYRLPRSAGSGGRRRGASLPPSLVSFPLFLQAETCVISTTAPLAAKGKENTTGQAPPKNTPQPCHGCPPPGTEEKSRLQHPMDSKTWWRGIRGKPKARQSGPGRAVPPQPPSAPADRPPLLRGRRPPCRQRAR